MKHISHISNPSRRADLRSREAPARAQSVVALTSERQRFESFLLELSTSFAQVRSEDIDRQIDVWLAKLARFIRVDRASLWEMSVDEDTVWRRHFYTLPGLEPRPPTDASTREFAWLTEQYRRGNTVVWSRVPDDVPPGATGELAWTQRVRAKSVLCIPTPSGHLICAVVFTCVRRYRNWSAPLISRLRLVAEIFTSAIVRRRAETALQSSEARNRAILQALPDLMFVFSPEGVYLDQHSRDEGELLLPPERFLGRNVRDVLPPDVAESFRRAFAVAAQGGGVVELEYTLPIRGVDQDYEARMVRRDDGAIVSIVRNVTARKRAARELRESEERFRGAFEHSGIGIALVSPEGRWLRVNPALCNIFGYSETELLATDFQSLTAPEDLATNMECLRRALAGEINYYELHKRYIHKDGHLISALLTVSLVRDVQGHPLYFVSQVLDLTEQTRAQLEIERLRLELAHSGRLALTGQLTASLAHELMQPITAVLSNAEAGRRFVSITDAANGFAAEEMQSIFADIVESCTHAAEVVRGVRSFLRKEPRPRGPVDLNGLVKGVAEVVRSELILRQVRLELQLDPQSAAIDADPVELQQVILNLLLNGAEAMSDNPPHDRDLVISTALRDRGVELSVRDRGKGADPANLNLMFEPFFTTKPDGMGMGLPICSEIVRRHKGRLWAENNAGGGMTLRCLLPRA